MFVIYEALGNFEGVNYLCYVVFLLQGHGQHATHKHVDIR